MRAGLLANGIDPELVEAGDIGGVMAHLAGTGQIIAYKAFLGEEPDAVDMDGGAVQYATEADVIALTQAGALKNG